MAEDYLWDRSGKASEEELALEEQLGKYRHVRKPLPKPKPTWWIYAAAASLLLGAWQFWPEKNSDWTMNGKALAINRVIQLSEKAEVEVGSIGRLRFEAGARFKILNSSPQSEVMELLEGKFDAFIIAAPYVFQVQTPPAKLDDLGCAYNVSVDSSGNGKVAVTSGWVRVNAQKQESLVRQGYEVDLVKGQAPSIPRRSMLASKDDPLQLLHRLWREPNPQKRAEAFDQLAALYPPPPSVTRDRALRGDPKLVSDYWPALDLGPAIKLPRIFYGE
jgi:ferric-dicitrate binding protein FerR (iron transport regulator)